MTNIIKLLPESVANQIAAGEVIQRPASAVKELLENALDAGADTIQLIIKDAGKTLIQVLDNGSGMSAIDVRMSFERHATSKINSADDLFAIRTMGFRGEALASIAAIAQVEVRTKPHDEELGTLLKIEGSKVIGQEAIAANPGSNIAVKNLFFNVPARRNFLKSNAAETRHIIEEFIRVSLINPEIGFSMTHNDKVVFKLNPESLKKRIVDLFGNIYNERLLTVEQKTDEVNISGFIGKAEFAKKTRGEQYFFVNGRFIKHAYLHHAVANAYHELIPTDAHPSYFIHIEVDPEEIDINIHPTKTEVNFRNARFIYAVLHAAVKQSIGKYNFTPTLDFDVEPSIEASLNTPPKENIPIPGIQVNPDFNPFREERKTDIPYQKPDKREGDDQWENLFQSSPKMPVTSDFPEVLKSNTEALDLEESSHVGSFFQVHGKYILTNVASGLMMIDQVKAKQRIFYEQYLSLLEGMQNPSQQQLFPEEVHFSPGDAEIIRTLKKELEKIGFIIEALGSNSFVINGIPGDLNDDSVTATLEYIIEQHKQESGDLAVNKNIILARSMAGKLSGFENKKMTQQEMSATFDQLFASTVPETAPDGSKILTIVPLADIDDLIKAKK